VTRLIPFAFLLLAGCASSAPPEPVVVTRIVEKPVAISCVPASVGGAPAYADEAAALRAAPDAAAREILLIAGRLQRIARLSILEPVVEGCRAAGVGP
jgi:hypothetical protein